MEETSRDSTDHYPEPGTHATECGTITTVDENALLKIIECDGCGEQHVQTRAHITVMVAVFGVIATSAFFTGDVVSSSTWTAEAVSAANAVLGTGIGIGTAWYLANVDDALEVNAGDER